MPDKENAVETEEDVIGYPISRQKQIELYRRCIADADQIVQEYDRKLQVASQFFSYRIGVLSNRVLDHNIREMNDEELNELLEDES